MLLSYGKKCAYAANGCAPMLFVSKDDIAAFAMPCFVRPVQLACKSGLIGFCLSQHISTERNESMVTASWPYQCCMHSSSVKVDCISTPAVKCPKEGQMPSGRVATSVVKML